MASENNTSDSYLENGGEKSKVVYLILINATPQRLSHSSASSPLSLQ